MTRALALLAAVVVLAGCTQKPSEDRLLCDKYCPQVDALLDQTCGASDDWELCKPWIDKVSTLVDEINTELRGKKDKDSQQYVHGARTDINNVREGIKGYTQLRCDEKIEIDSKDSSSRFFDCQKEWREISSSFTLLSVNLNGAANSNPFA
jgi:hypothetical protein